ncbi:MAG: hypothetical protein COT14_01785, partial [Candidatus Diapherotrites archaeon CG08_land_8_20_14_0_20_30_16]
MYLNRILVVFLATFVFFGFAFAGVDLSAGNIDFNDATVLYGTETVQITANYSNISIDTNAEGYNVYFYINSNLDSNVQHDENLNAGDSNTQDYNWTADEIGDINVYICLEAHALDDNANNDCNQTTLHVYSVDFNAIILYTSNDLPELGDFYFEYQAPVTIDFNFANNGDYNGDNNAETRLYKGATFDMRNTTFENLFVGNVVTASFDNLLLDWGTYDLNAIICYGTCDVPATDVN